MGNIYSISTLINFVCIRLSTSLMLSFVSYAITKYLKKHLESEEDIIYPITLLPSWVINYYPCW